MSDNWIVGNMQSAFNTWNGKLTEIWSLITTTPEGFREVEFNVAFDEFQQIYLEPEKREDKTRGATTILALVEKVGQAV